MHHLTCWNKVINTKELYLETLYIHVNIAYFFNTNIIIKKTNYINIGIRMKYVYRILYHEKYLKYLKI